MSGAPTLVTLGVDTTQTPAPLVVVRNGAIFATLGTYTTAGVWVPAGALLPANNLSDVASASTARTNLGLAAVAASGSASDLGTGTLPAARLPTPTTTTLGGTKALPASGSLFLTGIDTTGTPSAAQPAFSNLSGSATAAQMPAFSGDATSSAGTAALTLVASGVTAGTYGSTGTIPVITVDAKGRVTSATSAAPAVIDGCCRLSVASTTTLKLSPYGGNTLVIGGVQNTIPSAGITTASQTGLSASTRYYVYATASAGAVNALVISTTGHITGADGREYFNNAGAADTTQRLVGMVFTNTAAAPFVDSTSQRGCLNWFNRRTLQAEIDAANVTSSTTAAAYGNSATFLSWADEAVVFTLSGYAQPNTSGAVPNAYIGLDGATIGIAGGATAPAANAYVNVGTAFGQLVSEGNHALQNFGSVNTGSVTFTTKLLAIVRG